MAKDARRRSSRRRLAGRSGVEGDDDAGALASGGGVAVRAGEKDLRRLESDSGKGRSGPGAMEPVESERSCPPLLFSEPLRRGGWTIGLARFSTTLRKENITTVEDSSKPHATYVYVLRPRP
jgi:hypothetical protein